MSEYEIKHAIPDAETYLALRAAGGLSLWPKEAAEAGLPNTWHGVLIRFAGEVIGMGRVVGDGGCFFQIVDIVVHPDHQGKGLGKTIMRALVEALEDQAPKGAYVSLIADVPADQLYLQFGFTPTAPRSIAMARRV